MRKTIIAASILAALLIASAGYGFTWPKTKTIYSKGQDTWVKVKTANKKMQPLAHPHEFGAEDMEKLLLGVTLFKPGAFSLDGAKGTDIQVFSDDEAKQLAPHLAKAFATADSESWVDFSIMTFKGQSLVGSFRLTDGVMFVKDGKLNVAFRNIYQKKAPDQEMNKFDPTKGYRSSFKLVAQKGQELKDDNWIVVDAKNIPKPPPRDMGASDKPTDREPEKTAKERLTELQKLYDEGLITEEEYQKKREEILSEI